MKILNVELEDFDFNDADAVEKLEKSIDLAEKKLKALSPKGDTASGIIRKGCSIIFECFDSIFGAGTSQKIFGPKSSLKTCTEAFRDLKLVKDKQDQELNSLIGEIGNEYSPNRAARRAKK